MRIAGDEKDWGALVAAVWISSHAAYFIFYTVVTGFDRYASLFPMPLGLKIYALVASVVAWFAALLARRDTPARQRRQKRLMDLALVWFILSLLTLFLEEPVVQ